MQSRHGETVEVQTPEGKKLYKIVEKPIDPPNTIIRDLVPIETTEDDIPIGARLLDERETEGILARSAKPENIRVGDTVRLRTEGGLNVDNEGVKGTVDAQLTTGKFRVKWENGEKGRYTPKELAKVW